MSEPYPQKQVSLAQDDGKQVKALVDEIQGRLGDLASLVSRVADVPLATERDAPARFELRESVDLGGLGVLLIPLPTDPPLLACAYYQDGEYTRIVVPCTGLDFMP